MAGGLLQSVSFGIPVQNPDYSRGHARDALSPAR
jgi:hypothetical protein